VTSLKERGAVLLVEPQDPLNIGSVVRVCRNTGIGDLRLLAPAPHDPHRVTITAPNSAEWIGAHVRTFDTWEAAVHGCQRLYAFTARGREERQRRMRLPELIDEIAASDATYALVFGREDSGLPNEIVDRCDAFVTLETDAEYASYNLAQAVLLGCHAILVRTGDAVELKPPSREFPAATHDDVERLVERATVALEEAGFFKGTVGDNVVRTIRRVFVRASLDKQEMATFMGAFTEVVRALRNARTR
jgi:tRNA/rRNA methyltransferase/tRNA (cytidine32/uridine32-2'-O)-methyltransferase